jgi:hypothetical protein
MRQDKGTMKLRLEAIKKLVQDVKVNGYIGDKGMWQAGYDIGQSDLAKQVRDILSNPISGHKVTNEEKARKLYLEQQEKEAAKRWMTLDDQTKAAWLSLADKEKEKS